MIAVPGTKFTRLTRRASLSSLLVCWVTSLAFHVLIAVVGLTFGFDRAGIPDGPGRRRPLHITASFGQLPRTTQLPATTTLDSPVDFEAPPPIQPDDNAAESTSPTIDDAPAAQRIRETAVAEEPVGESPPEQEGAGSPERVFAETEPDAVPSRLASVTQGTFRPRRQSNSTSVAGAINGGPVGDQFGKPNGASFFQSTAQGQHFCYVVDCSNSMEEDDTIGLARAELLASLERLHSTQRFQIIFYDSELHPFTAGGKTVFPATEANRRLATQFVSSQQPTGRAVHRPALLAALQSKPDVIFFLTDGEVPELSARDLYDLKSANRRRTQIHIVEFGNGAKLETNWLDQLARDNHGSCTYEDRAALRE